MSIHAAGLEDCGLRREVLGGGIEALEGKIKAKGLRLAILRAHYLYSYCLYSYGLYRYGLYSSGL